MVDGSWGKYVPQIFVFADLRPDLLVQVRFVVYFIACYVVLFFLPLLY